MVCSATAGQEFNLSPTKSQTNWWAASNFPFLPLRSPPFERVGETVRGGSAIESVPPLDRVKCALENELWNRRRLNLRTWEGEPY